MLRPRAMSISAEGRHILWLQFAAARHNLRNRRWSTAQSSVHLHNLIYAMDVRIRLGCSAEAEQLVQLDGERPAVQLGQHGLRRRQVDLAAAVAGRDIAEGARV